MVFQTLNKLKWTNKLKDCKIVIRDRKENGNEKLILGKDITELKKTYLLYKSGNEETFIPLHRVVEIFHKEKSIWKKPLRNKNLL